MLHVRQAILTAAVLLGTAVSASAAPGTPATPVLDGRRDDGYRLLAQDPAGDLLPYFAGRPDNSWADLTNLYVTTDTTNLWIYVDLPKYSDQSVGEFGLAIDTDGVAASGSSSGPNPSGITFAYTSTRNNVGATPVLTTTILLPDVLVHGYLLGSHPNRWTDLYRWTGSLWSEIGVNWGGVTTTTVGAHIGFSYDYGLELSIPFADLSVPPTATLHLEFYATGANTVGSNGLSGAWDTVPSDAQSHQQYQLTTLHRLATFNPRDSLPAVSLSSAAYEVRETDGVAPITVTVAPTSTQLMSVRFQTTDGTAGPSDYLTVSQVITFAPGQSSRVVPLAVLTDMIVEPDETVFIALSQPINAELAAPITATLIIHDTPPTVMPGRLFLPMVRR